MTAPDLALGQTTAPAVSAGPAPDAAVAFPARSALPLAGLAVPSAEAAIEVGRADDPAEHEADRTAAAVVSRLRRRHARVAEIPLPARHVHAGGPVRRAFQPVADGSTVGPDGGPLPSGLTALLARSKGAGQALPSPLRRQLEPVIGADLGAVRVHTGSDAGRLSRSMQAQAFTLGSDIYFRDGLPDTDTDQGMTVLAHEVTHTLQGDDHASRRTIRRLLFTPFSDLTPVAASVEGMRMDQLLFHGLSYSEGGTTGNSVNMEHMVNNTGGNSAPGEPTGIWRLRQVDPRLVWGAGQQQAATAMHAINGDFTEGANDEARNIFMGTAASNTDLHYHMVEKPIRAAFQSNPSGLALDYERALAQWPPMPHPSQADVLVWCDPSVRMPGATQVGQSNVSWDHQALPGHVTHVVTVKPSIADAKERPRVVQYTVEPKYTYGSGDQLPAFLQTNVLRSLRDIWAARQPDSGFTEDQVNEQCDATEYLVDHGHNLFPETFTCTAVYWVASYLPNKPWLQQTQSDNYDAEKVSAKRALEPDIETSTDSLTVSLKKAKRGTDATATTSTGSTDIVADEDVEMTVVQKPQVRPPPKKYKAKRG
ncbi:MAG: hypothetical protein JWO57_420 [Pseudonocardiales bacterium]|nr:hypothetical protein [Pseudonocardiales bacterium]